MTYCRKSACWCRYGWRSPRDSRITSRRSWLPGIANVGIGSDASIASISRYSAGRPQSARSPVASTQSGAGSSAAMAATARRSIAFVSMPPYAMTPRGRTWKSVIWAMIIGVSGAGSRCRPHRSSSLHQRRRFLLQPLEPGLRLDLATHDAGDDLALRAPRAHRVAARVALPRHRTVHLERDGLEVRVLVVERAEEFGSRRPQVRRQVACRLDDDLLRFRSRDVLQELPRCLLLLRVARRDDRRIAAGRQAALRLVVDRKDRRAQRELVADQVRHLAQPRRRVEEDSDLAGDELLPRLIPVDQRHAAF